MLFKKENKTSTLSNLIFQTFKYVYSIVNIFDRYVNYVYFSEVISVLGADIFIFFGVDSENESWNRKFEQEYAMHAGLKLYSNIF